MTEKRYDVVDLLETLAISVDDECKYYQNCNDDYLQLCNELNALHEENQQLKEPSCSKCIHLARDETDNYCMEQDWDWIEDFSIANKCENYESVFE